MLKSQQMRALKNAPRQRPYSCDVCPKQFETPSKLARHYLTHTGQKPFQCQDCLKSFRQLVHLERHMITHTLPFQCNICHRHFKNADTFSKHQRLHVEGARLKGKITRKPVGPRQRRRLSQPLHCFGCQRTFESEETRLLHQCDFANIAAGCRKPETQQCDLCDKAFPSRSKLERHIMIHTGQKPFACVLCGKSFRQKAHLKIHLLTHTQERPFQCSQCFKAFKTPDQLLKHGKMHSRVSRVQINVGISATKSLQVKEEPDEVASVYVVPFQCSSCGQSFDSQQTLDNHMCEGINTRVAITCDWVPVKKAKKLIFLDCHGKIISDDPEPSESLLKANLEGTEYGDPDTMEYPQLVVPRNILQLHPQQKRKPPRKQFGQSHLLHGRSLRNQHLNDNRMAGNKDAGTMQSTCLAAEQRHPGRVHHFLQQAQGIFMPRHKARRCDRCEKTFPTMSKLRRHYLIHTGQKPFTCTECGKNFRQSAHLKRHQVTHAEKEHLIRSQITLGDHHSSFDQWQENPGYQLHPPSENNKQDFSQMTFAVPDVKVEAPDLPEVIKKPVAAKRARVTLPRVHNAARKSSQERPLQKTRTRAAQKGYRCSVCSKSFLTPSKLERHHLTHSGQRPFVCQECGKCFRQDPHLKRHMVTHVKTTE